jgi:hypothetical protein
VKLQEIEAALAMREKSAHYAVDPAERRDVQLMRSLLAALRERDALLRDVLTTVDSRGSELWDRIQEVLCGVSEV